MPLSSPPSPPTSSNWRHQPAPRLPLGDFATTPKCDPPHHPLPVILPKSNDVPTYGSPLTRHRIRNETIRLSSAADVNSQQNCQPTPARQRTKQYDGVYARAGQGGGRTASNGPDAQQRGSWDAPQRVKGRCTAIFSTVLYLVWMDGHVPECVAGPAAQCQFAIANVYQG